MSPDPGSEFDLLIARGRVVDGTGNPWHEADVALRGGRIAAIGRIDPGRAARVFDARGLAVAPGFIDVHTHVEIEEAGTRLEALPTADNFLHMGVTSVITGNCGMSELPVGAWLERIERAGASINVGSLVGHNTVRRVAMGGDFDRAPTSEELERMRGLVERAMREGAVGFSTGLVYVPGRYAALDEIVELARTAAELGGLYTTHMRDEADHVEEAIREALEIGRQAGCPVQISHFKISSSRLWGRSPVTVGLVEEARARGQSVTVDQYLYTASSTSLDVLFPAWLFDGGPERVRQRLLDPESRGRVRADMLGMLRARGRADLSYAVVASHLADPALNGKSLPEIALQVRGKEGVEEETEQAIDMLLAGGAAMLYFVMSDQDVEHIFRQSFTMVASDGEVVDPAGASVPHPRSFGNNARALGRYTREKGLVGLEEAVRKMTSLPAQTFGLWERGLLRPGLAADVVVFDPARVQDLASYERPKRYAAGFELVVVNGDPVIQGGRHTGARPGQILRGPGTERPGP